MKRYALILCLPISGCFELEEGTPPVIEPLPPIQAVAGENIRVDIHASDEDGDVLTYSLSDNPDWISLSHNIISATPTQDQVGDYTFFVSASDGIFDSEIEATLVVSATSSITPESTDNTTTSNNASSLPNANISSNTTSPTAPIKPKNSAPVIDALPAMQAVATQTTQVNVVASDTDGDTLSYLLLNNPSWVILKDQVISITPSLEHAGLHTFKVSVSDGLLTTEIDTSLRVIINDAPSIDAIAPMTLDIQTPSQYQVVAKDKENDPLTYKLDSAPDFVSIDAAGLLSVTALSVEGNYTFQILVSDGFSESTQAVTMTLNNPFYGSDNDNDSIDDGVEVKYGLNPNDPADAYQDNDGDGLSNLEELLGKPLLMQYNAQYDGAILDNPLWRLDAVGDASRMNMHNHDYVEKNGVFIQQLHDDDGSRSANMDLVHGLKFDKFAKELYQHGGLLTLYLSIYRQGGAVRLFIPPSYAIDFKRKALMLELNRLNTDGVRLQVITGSTVDFATGHPDGTVHKLEIEFFGKDSYGGEIRLDGNLIQNNTTNIFVTPANLKEGLTLSTAKSSYRGFDIHRTQFYINDQHPVTDPALKDTDNDKIDDNIEIELGLNPLDPNDGYDSDTDGDGLSNGIEIANGFDPLNIRDQINVDSDGDGVNNDIEIYYGMDPFVANDLTVDIDNDGLTSAVELEYALNPNDPTDGFNVDSDGDGVSNGDEINNNTNPNDHKLQLKDHFTIKLIVDDTNNDGRINTNDATKSVTLDRYSVRKDNAELIFYRDQPENRYTFISLLPEVRTFRGRVDGIPDSAVYATIWEDCLISYSVFFGSNAKPDFRLGADAAHISFENSTFDHTAVCNTTNPSDAKYQRGLKANLEPVAYRAELDPPAALNYFPKSSDFHLFERSQSYHASYRTWSFDGKKDINRTIALMEHQANISDLPLARTYYERISISDFLIELTGNGDADDGTTRDDWASNWNTVRNEFWVPRRVEPDKYWYEHVYWNPPDVAEGLAYGQWIQSVLGTNFFVHEIGHNMGSLHDGHTERYQGTNIMGLNTIPAASTIVHQNIASPRREVVKDGLTQHKDLRIGIPHWNYHPLAQPDHISIYRDETGKIDVLENDYDANNHKLTITSAAVLDDTSDIGAIATKLTITSDQKIDITPPKGFIGLIDAYYIIEDETGLSTRGIMHINVEHDGISDVITYDHNCVDDHRGVATHDGKTGYGALFSSEPRDTKIAVANQGYNRRTKDSTGQDISVSCASHVSSPGNSADNDDKAATWGSIQYPLSNNQLRNNVRTDHLRANLHLFEVNNKDFSVMFWFKPSADYTGYTVLARRGRVRAYNFDGDGWIIGANGTTLIMKIHDKSQFTRNRLLTLEVKNLSELTDTGSWAHIAMTIDWANRELIAYLNGQQVGKVAIPAEFSMVSSSGTLNAYGWGSYAVFGQLSGIDGSEPGFNSTPGNNGFDDLVIAHSTLTPAEVQSMYQGKLPAYDPRPVNGKHIDMNDVLNLVWQPHTDIQADVVSYNVYLAEDDLSISTRDASSLLGNQTLTSYDVSGRTFDPSKAYYWAVDTVLTDGTIIPGEIWSFWEYQPSTVKKQRRQEARYQFVHGTEVEHKCRGVHIDFWLSEQRNLNKG